MTSPHAFGAVPVEAAAGLLDVAGEIVEALRAHEETVGHFGGP